MGSKTTKYALVLFLIFIGLGALLFMRETTRWPIGPLSNIQKKINSEAEIIYKTGRDGKVICVLPEENGTLVISPPYADISSLGKDVFSSTLLKKIQHFVDSQETGHLFYIKQGNLSDHRLLSGLIEPVLGLKSKKEIVLLISRKPTSGRPIRVEIEN